MRSYITTIAVLALAAWTNAGSCETIDVKYTFYGYPDNSPPGPAIAYDCGRGYKAGGDGSYDNPLTFATAPGEFDKCEILWSPYLKKYIRFEDTCATCIKNWKHGKKYHIDIWTGSRTVNGGQNQIQCEDDLTPGAKQPVVVDPPTDYTAQTKPLYANDVCYTGRVYPQ